MKCSRCGAEMKIKNVKVDTDMYGNPVCHKYAYCYHCKIRRRLSSQPSVIHTSGQKRNRTKSRKRRKSTVLLLVIILIVLAAVAAGCFLLFRHKKASEAAKDKTVVTDTRKNLITADAYSRLKTGMTLTEAEDLIGTDGNKLLQTSGEENITERYQWITKDGKGTVLLTFSDNKLTSLSQTGIEDGGIVSLTPEIKESIKGGMTYEDVKKAVGTDGIRISETAADGTTTSVYAWKDRDTGDSFSIVMRDDKVQAVNQEETASSEK